MKKAKDFRAAARRALMGNWGIAVLAGLIASLLGGSGISYGGISSIDLSEEEMSQISSIDPETAKILMGTLAVIFSIAFVIGIVLFLIGSIIEVGYNRFNLNLIDGEELKISQVVSFFSHWTKAIAVSFLRWLYTFLWTLLFIIPGIIASYSYSMATFILAENPDMPAKEALRLSKEMMRGNKWRLFCLSFSFIGWSFLCVFTLGIGYLWLMPYEKAAVTDFYREISGTRKAAEIPAEPAPEAPAA